VGLQAKKMMREMLTFWRKTDKDEKEGRVRGSRSKPLVARNTDEAKEAERQDRKLNFLITQTEL
jgi:DNA helicase INO80